MYLHWSNKQFFNINFINILGIQGILDAYTNCIQQIKLYGPTNVSPIIYHVARFAEAAQQEEATKGAHVCTIINRLNLYISMLALVWYWDVSAQGTHVFAIINRLNLYIFILALVWYWNVVSAHEEHCCTIIKD